MGGGGCERRRCVNNGSTTGLDTSRLWIDGQGGGPASERKRRSAEGSSVPAELPCIAFSGCRALQCHPDRLFPRGHGGGGGGDGGEGGKGGRTKKAAKEAAKEDGEETGGRARARARGPDEEEEGRGWWWATIPRRR